MSTMIEFLPSMFIAAVGVVGIIGVLVRLARWMEKPERVLKDHPGPPHGRETPAPHAE